MNTELLRVLNGLIQEKMFNAYSIRQVEINLFLRQPLYARLVYEINKMTSDAVPLYVNDISRTTQWIKYNYSGAIAYIICDGPENEDTKEFIKIYNSLMSKNDL